MLASILSESTDDINSKYQESDLSLEMYFLSSKYPFVGLTMTLTRKVMYFIMTLSTLDFPLSIFIHDYEFPLSVSNYF